MYSMKLYLKNCDCYSPIKELLLINNIIELNCKIRQVDNFTICI